MKPEDCEYPEETEETKWEEAEAVRIVAYRSEEDPANRSDSRDYCYESQYSPEEEAAWISPLMLTRLVSPPLDRLGFKRYRIYDIGSSDLNLANLESRSGPIVL